MLWSLKGAYTYIAPLLSESPRTAEALRYGTCSQGISQFYLHTHTFIRNRKEPYLPLPSQPQLVLIYRPRRDGRLSRPWREVAQAEIRTRNLSKRSMECILTMQQPHITHIHTLDNGAPIQSGSCKRGDAHCLMARRWGWLYGPTMWPEAYGTLRT